MEQADVNRLFELLRQLYPNARQVQANNGVLKQTWGLVLEPYEYRQIRAAAIDYARGNKFFPDVADLTMGLPAAQRERSAPPVVHREEDVEKMAALAERLAAKYREAGVQPPSEAVEMGWTLERWSQACRAAGI